MSESDPRTVHLDDPDVGPPWPPDPAAFVDTSRCPACFTAITGARCTACGLDLTMPQLAEVLDIGRRFEELATERAALISALRAEQASAERAARVAEDARRLAEAAREADERAALERARAERDREAARAVAAADELPPASSLPMTAAAAETTMPPATDTGTARALAHRFSMQFTILGVGVILTSVGAIVFLFWAYLVVGLEVRSMIIAGASVGVLALAWFLRRRGLVLTGEGVGVVAIILLMLDAWIIRANQAFGTEAIPQLAYYGAAAIVLAALLVVARRLTSLRVAGYAAAGLAPLGVAMLAASFVPDTGSTRWWVAGLAALAMGIAGVRLLPRSRPAWTLVAFSGTIGLAAIGGAFDALPDLRWHALISFGAAAALWGGLAWAARGRLEARIRAICLGLAGLSAAAAPAVAAVQELSTRDAGWVAPAGSALVACAIAAFAIAFLRVRPAAVASMDAVMADAATADPTDAVDVAANTTDADAADADVADVQTPGPLARALTAHAGTLIAATVATVVALPGVALGLVRLMQAAVAGFAGWNGSVGGSAFGSVRFVIDAPGPAVAPLALAAVFAAVLAVLGRLRSLPVLPAAVAAWAALVAATYPAGVWGALAYTLLAVASLALGVVARARQLRALAASAEVAAGALLLSLAAADPRTWPLATALFLAVAIAGFLVAGRTWDGDATRRSRVLHLAVAATTACVSAAFIPAWAMTMNEPLVEPWSSPWMWVTTAAAVILAVLVVCRRLPNGETWAVSGPALTAGFVGLAGIVVSPASVAWMPTLALALVAGVGVAVDRRVPLRTSLAALVPVATAVAAWNLVPVLAIDHGYRWVAVAAVLLLLAGAGLFIRLPRGAAPALAWFVSIGAVAAISVAASAASDQWWLVLLLVAPIPYLAAAVTGEPTAGRSPWRHVAWLTPAIGLAALWTALGVSGATLVEAYTLPAAAVLLAMAMILAVRRPLTDASAARGRVALAWAGAATAVLPSVAASADPALRPILTVCAGAIALAVSPWCTAGWRGIPVRVVVIATGGVAIAGAAAVRGTALAAPGDWSADAWALAALVGGLAAAFLLDRATDLPRPIAGLAAGLAIIAGSVPAVVLAARPALPMWLLLAPVVVLGVVHVATGLQRLTPLPHPIARWTALAALATLGAATVVLSGIDPFDPVTALVGASILLAGVLGRRPGLAWAGAAAGLIPSIAASSQPALRALLLVGLGAALLVGARWVPKTVRMVPLREIAIAAAAASTVGAAGMRGLAVATVPALAQAEPWGAAPWAADLWGAAALAGGLVAAALMLRLTDAPAFVSPGIAASAIAVAVMPAVAIAAQGDQPTALLLAPVIVFALLRVAVAIPQSRPLSHPLVTLIAVLASVVLGGVTLVFGDIDPFDIVTVITGASLLAGALISGRRFGVWAGAAVALVPSVIASGEPALRPVIVAGVGLLLAVALVWIPRTVRGVPLRLVAMVAAVVAGTGAATVRALSLALFPGAVREAVPGIQLDRTAAVELWAGIALVIGLGAVTLWCRRNAGRTRIEQWMTASVVVVSAIPVALVAGIERPLAIALAPVIVLALLHVVSALPAARPLSDPLPAWTILGTLAVVSLLTLVGRAVDPFDLVTATVGLAMVAAGLIRMRRTPTLRSWPALGPGFAVLLVPSLIADYTDPVTWRLVTVGIVALATMLFGILRRLQAPFLLGAAVLVVHGVTQLWPIIARNYDQVWWWLWIAIAGVILIAIAATYERQLRFAKRMIRTVASLR
ncbi:SCO7613 C-terminal domain-containing membrane protein [Microbacterium sp. ASV49]|uniref:DUF2157 domain-containing protein n=1 Tax=Microbacterium candidum TaxID=3041922 RepID=A0ABT7N1H2_9MICO|nr:hypothetical protein [Microbacterium sp. ASV49]MDL9980520.1 hypothetical protein [Microbacterium sp. ASV49]